MTRDRGPRRGNSEFTATFTYEDGTVEERTHKSPRYPMVPSTAKIPRRQMLATVQCPAGHDAAVIRRPSGSSPAMLLVHAPAGAGVAAVLVDGGVAVVAQLQQELVRTSEVAASVEFTCMHCGAICELHVDDVPADPRADTVQIDGTPRS